MARRGRLRIGTSGWVYPHWRGIFYPRGLPAARWLPYYAEHFDTVEVNNTFYHLPTAAAVEGWRRAAPRGFLFSVKASRYLTHIKRLAPERGPIETFFGRAGMLGSHLGPILFQLPPTARADPGRLAGFLSALPRRHRYCFEFRHPSWFVEEVYTLLRRGRVALCVAEREGRASPLVVTARFVYMRFHGSAQAGGGYGARALRPWAERLGELLARGVDCYVYFNNDAGGHAVRDAQALCRLLAPAPRQGRHGGRGRAERRRPARRRSCRLIVPRA